ncbi:putative glycosyl transferase, family 14 [Helianthus debilis subsp. tardiflorus]
MGIKDMHRRSRLRKPTWIIILVSLVCVFLVVAYIYPPQDTTACYILSSSSCQTISRWRSRSPPERELSEEETAARVVIENLLNTPSIETKNPKIAFMFLSPGSLAFERLWDKFFQGHEGKFSIHIHASKAKPVHYSRYFQNREIHSDKVDWGKISMIDAEKRLLANALKDPDNRHFVLLSDSCVPLRSFEFVYSYLMYTDLSFIDSFEDPGPHGSGRYSEHMLPEVEKKHFRKGAQWFTMKRQHAIIVMADSLYYTKFRDYCKPGMDGRNCYADEHYLPTFFHMFDPSGIANWSVTHVDWSERKWHPKSYGLKGLSLQLIKNLTSITESVHETSNAKRVTTITPCMWNGVNRPCYLFARKFLPETLDKMIDLFPSYTTI